MKNPFQGLIAGSQRPVAQSWLVYVHQFLKTFKMHFWKLVTVEVTGDGNYIEEGDGDVLYSWNTDMFIY